MNISRPKPGTLRSRALLALPSLAFLLLVYWYGLKNWFEQDDFAWLGLHAQVYSWQSFLTAMFAPMAQGTIRPWSERGFFLLFYRLFESNALPYHIAVFVTHAANLILLTLVLWKLTASRVTAAMSPLLWTANSALLTPLCWVSDYNQVQCAFFLLLAFLLYLHGRYWWQFTIFVLGFGALELNIVYPALLLAYILTCRYSKQRVLGTLPLFAVSLGYYLLHSFAAPTQATGVYALHVDRALPATLSTYWSWVWAPVNAHQPVWTVILFSLALAAYCLLKRDRLALFFLLWFFITLAPTLPLRDHISDYYLAIPTLGIGAVLALALRRAPRFALVPVLFYLFIHIPLDRFGARWYFGHTRAVRNLVWGVRQAQQLHPGKTILLTGISDGLYLDAIAHSVFRTLDITNVYLAPELTEQVARLDPANPDAVAYVLPPGPTIHALQKENLIVYSASGERLKNISSVYERAAGERFGWDEQKNLPERVDVGSPLLAYLLGSSWYSPVGNFRWMPARASLRIGGPRAANQKLIVSGYCPPEQTESGPLTLSVSIDGQVLFETKLFKPETSFSRTFVLPASVIGHGSIEIGLAVDRTLEKPAGSPKLGLAFGIFELR